MTDAEAGVRREAEAGNSFGRVASGEALALAAASAAKVRNFIARE